MTESSRHDAWQVGDNYDCYMGRWSRQIAPHFLRWLNAREGLEWLEVGCGTGALSAAIMAQSGARGLIAIDPSESFLSKARTYVPDGRAEFRQGDAGEVPLPTASRDIVVSGLVLNFLSDREKALVEMRRVLRPGGRLGFYVWDYPGGGVEFMRAFWSAATSLDSNALDLTEDKRFPFCSPDQLADLVTKAGFHSIDTTAIEAPTVFKDFEDLWHPFTLGSGPAPGYCVGLEPELRLRLKERLRLNLPYRKDGSIPLKVRAWAVEALAP